MATEIKVWEVRDGGLELVDGAALESEHVEAELESWIAKTPNILGDDLLVIARQRAVEGVGRLDLLLVDRSGKLVVVELKRSSTPREAIAQALDYASWLDTTTEDQIALLAEEYLQCPLAEAFSEHFQSEMPAVVCQNHRILLVAPKLDSAAERIINYLASRYDVDVNAIFFKYVKLPSGQELLIRSVLVPESARPPLTPPPSLATVIRKAEERKVGHVLEICRQMNSVWQEQPSRAYGGSFRYWAEAPDGAERMVYGLNVAGDRMRTPVGELDVWFPTKRLSECTGVGEAEIRRILAAEHPQLVAQPTDCIIRIKTTLQAEQLIRQLKAWTTARGGAAEAVST